MVGPLESGDLDEMGQWECVRNFTVDLQFLPSFSFLAMDTIWLATLVPSPQHFPHQDEIFPLPVNQNKPFLSQLASCLTNEKSHQYPLTGSRLLWLNL